jgi:hypothetical protein
MCTLSLLHDDDAFPSFYNTILSSRLEVGESLCVNCLVGWWWWWWCQFELSRVETLFGSFTLLLLSSLSLALPLQYSLSAKGEENVCLKTCILIKKE